MNKTRSDRIEDLSSTLTYIELTLVVTVMIVLCLVTIVGNALVLVSFAVDRKLRTLGNYFLLSLAISDVMIATFSMPLTIVYVLVGEWNLGRAVCNMWLAQDYVCSNASVLNLLMIAVDRYYSVTSPLKYRAKRTARRVWSMIAFVWVISFLLYPPWIYAWPYIEGRDVVPEDDCYVQFLETNIVLTVVMVVLDYYIPISVILVLYYRIWRETRRRSRYLADMKGESVCLQALDSPPRGSDRQRRSQSTKTVRAGRSNGSADRVGTFPDKESESTLDQKPESVCVLPQNSCRENNEQRSPKTVRAGRSNGSADRVGTFPDKESESTLDQKPESVCLLSQNSCRENNKQRGPSPKTVRAGHSNGSADRVGTFPDKESESTLDQKPESVCLLPQNSCRENNKQRSPSPKTVRAGRSNGSADRVGTFPDKESESTLDQKSESACLLPQNSCCENNKQRSPKTVRASHSDGNSDPELESRTVLLTDNGTESTLDPKSGSACLRPENSSPSSSEKSRQRSHSPKSTLADNELDSMTTDDKSVGGGEYPDSKVSDVDSTLSDHSVRPKICASPQKGGGDGTKPDKAARVLTVILCAFFITSFPYNVTVIIKNLDSSQTLISDAVFTFCYYLFYVNSTLNPFCYALANENFRRTYWRILTCSWARNPAGTYSVASYSSKSSEGKISCNARHVTSPV